MTDVTTNSAGEDEFYDNAETEFPDKEDLDGRLVAIWPTGKSGQRKGNGADAKFYDWVETVTLVLDDGIDGDKATDKVGPALQRLDSFQFSQGGLTGRLLPRINKKDPNTGKQNFRPMCGRINSKKNKIKGFNDSWSISTPTDADMEILRKYRAQIVAITDEMATERQKDADTEAFG